MRSGSITWRAINKRQTQNPRLYSLRASWEVCPKHRKVHREIPVATTRRTDACAAVMVFVLCCNGMAWRADVRATPSISPDADFQSALSQNCILRMVQPEPRSIASLLIFFREVIRLPACKSGVAKQNRKRTNWSITSTSHHFCFRSLNRKKQPLPPGRV